MNATSNPQAAAEQARKNYRDVTTHDMSVPEAVRAMAERAMDQSREVYDRSKDAHRMITAKSSISPSGM